MHTCVSMQLNKINFASLLSLSLQRNQVQSGSALKRSPPTPGRRACRLEWGCQGSGLGTPSLSGSRWPCSCKWQLRSPSTVQVRAYHGGHVFCGRVADKERGMGGSFICRQCLCVYGRALKGGLKRERLRRRVDCFVYFLEVGVACCFFSPQLSQLSLWTGPVA